MAALRLEHIANDDPGSFCGEQASLSGALPACSPLMSMTFPLRRSILSSTFLKKLGALTGPYHAMLAVDERVSSSPAFRHLNACLALSGNPAQMEMAAAPKDDPPS